MDFFIVQLLFPCLGVMLLRSVGVLLSSVVKEIGGIVHFPDARLYLELPEFGTTEQLCLLVETKY